MGAQFCIRLAGLCGQCVHVVGDETDGPVLEVVGYVVLSFGRCDGHVARDALVVLDGASKVDTSHRLDENVQIVTRLHRRQHDTLLVFHAVDLSDKFPVDEHLRVVVSVADGQSAWLIDFGQGSGIEGRSPSHVHFLEGWRVVALHRACDELTERDAGGELRLGEAYQRSRRLGNSGQGFASIVFLHGVSQLKELRCCAAIFIDRRVVVVGCHVGCEARAVGSSPVSETRSSVCHI